MFWREENPWTYLVQNCYSTQHIKEHDGATVLDSQTVVVSQEILSISRPPDSETQCEPQTQVPGNTQEDPHEKIQPANPAEGTRQRLPGGRGSEACAARPQERDRRLRQLMRTPDRFLQSSSRANFRGGGVV